MDLAETLRTTGAVRQFLDEPVDDATLYRVIDTARFSPSGGNRQGWRLVVVKDADRRRRLRDLYLSGWYQYLAQSAAGLVPWAPVTDDEAERRALATADDVAARSSAGAGGFAEHLDTVPVLLLLLADLRSLAAVDRDRPRYTMAGGASIYPFAWSLLLAARAEGLAGVLTTVAIRREDDVKALFGVPDELIVAGVVALGRPLHQPTRLRRRRVAEFTTVDGYGGAAFAPPGG